MSDEHAPRAPALTYWMLWKQALRDAQGKEVQDAITYSYVWLADQTGHIFQGFVANFVSRLMICHLIRRPIGLFGPTEMPAWACVWGTPAVAVLAVGMGDAGLIYQRSAHGDGAVPARSPTLRYNAFIAWAYMALGVAIGYAFQLPEYGLRAFIVLVLLGVIPGRYLGRQEDHLAEGALPYLFRLADLSAPWAVKARTCRS